LHVAALRETFEECGLLLGQAHALGLVERVREATAAGVPFAAALPALGLQLNTACVVPWSRWVTPRIPSVTNKRFDTRFFVAVAPEEQVVEHCAREATEAVWLSPRRGLERYLAGEIDLAPPQIMSLCELSRLADVAQVLAFARGRPPILVEPEPFDDDEGRRVICYPGDPRHSVAAPVWVGPTRLLHRNHRFEPDGGIDAMLG
jgi:8-oxo-dGTP pyrophosphatase MutT (NUDIX family)